MAIRFTGGSVTFEELDTFMALRFAREPIGKDALDFEIRERVLELEAARRGIRVEPAELREALTRVEADIVAQARHSLEEELELKGMDRATFEGIYRTQLLCEKLVRADLGIPRGEGVRREQQELWLSERVKGTKVVKDNLPPGIVAVVLDSKITKADLGRTIRLKLGRSDVRDAARALAALHIVEARARELEIDVGPEQIRAAIERRRERFAADPRMVGLTFEQLLEARGTSIDELERDRGVRAEALLHEISRRLYSDDEIDRRYDTNRAAYDDRFGEARRVSWILLHASQERNPLIKRTFDDADAELTALAQRASSVAEFARLATLHSTDDTSRQRGGDLGWMHRREPGVEPSILAAVFAPDARVDRALGPVRSSHGSALLWITAQRPAPARAAIRAAIRAELAAEVYRKLVSEARVTTYLDPPAVESNPSDVK